MKISIPRERRAHERRVAATPETVKKFVALGIDVAVEAAADEASPITEAAYRLTGPIDVGDPAQILADADIFLKVHRHLLAGEDGPDALALMNRGASLVAILSPYADPNAVQQYAAAGVTAMALEFVPRITRAQSMDVLSSQSNLAGYRAVLEAVNVYDRAMPMMMTAAGTLAH